MLRKDIVSAAVKSYKKTFDEAVRAAQTLSLEHFFSLPFNTASIDAKWIKKSLEELRTGYKKADKRKCVIYVFSLVDPHANELITESLQSHKTSRKLDKKKDNLCTVNGSFKDSITLYVGRSFTPRSRISQHLGESDSQTYAMHLQQWAGPLELELRLDVYDVPGYRDTAPLERGMNVLETGLWDYLQPLLGRRGDK